MVPSHTVSSSAARQLLSFFLLFLIGSVSAQYTTASDGDYCFDPQALETSTTKYSNSTVSATVTKSSATSVPTTSPAPTSTVPVGNAAGALAPEVVLGLVAAFVAL